MVADVNAREALFRHREVDWVIVTCQVLIAFCAAPVLAALIDLASWSFTGHEVFPWIGHALNQPAVSVKVSHHG